MDADPDDVRAQLIRFIRAGRSFSGHERNCCYLNTGKTRFANVSAISGLDFPDDGRAVGCVDWDQDGDVDVWISNRNAPQIRFLRNAISNGNHFLSVRLEGTRCNRDAIGARVELTTVGDGQQKRIKSLRAGDGYLAQSSKWLHFGLGNTTTVDRVVVSWPGGHEESFSGLAADGCFRLVEGTGLAQPIARPRRDVVLKPSPLQLPRSSDQRQVFSATRLPLPELRYETFSGAARSGAGEARRALLVNLWASWCGPCVAELGELARRAEELRGQGVDVLALSVDRLGDAPQGNRAAELVSRVQFPFAAGLATERLVDILELAMRQLFSREKPLPIPTSFLVDPQGRLAAVYQGPVDVDRLLVDVRKLALTGVDKRDASVPFAGRWNDTPKSLPLVPFVIELINHGYLDQASDYLARYRSDIRPEHFYERLILRLASAWEEHGNRDEAERHFRWAQQMNPQHVVAEVQHGLALERQGRHAEAMEKYHEALERNSLNVSALNNLAWLLATSSDPAIRDGRAAVELAERAAHQTGFQNPGVLDTLSAAYAETGMFDRAVSTAERAADLARASGKTAMADRIEKRKDLYQRSRAYHGSPP